MTYSEIEKQFSELSDRIDTLQALYEQINNFVIQHFVLFWAIIVGVFAIIGVALYFIAKSVAQKGVDKAIYDFSMRINKLEKQINEISENFNPPQEFELPLSAGVHTAPNLKSTYCKASNNLVIVTISIKINDPTAQTIQQIATLPTGFRPTETIICSNGKFEITIKPNGIIEASGISRKNNIICSTPICFFYR